MTEIFNLLNGYDLVPIGQCDVGTVVICNNQIFLKVPVDEGHNPLEESRLLNLKRDIWDYINNDKTILKPRHIEWVHNDCDTKLKRCGELTLGQWCYEPTTDLVYLYCGGEWEMDMYDGTGFVGLDNETPIQLIETDLIIT